MAELNGGSRVSEFRSVCAGPGAVPGDGSITREELKPAITLWRYLQHEQTSSLSTSMISTRRTMGR